MAKDRQKVIQSAEKLVAKGRIQAAIDQYHRVLDRHPNDTSTLNRVGDLYARLNRLPKAIELFRQTAESFGRQGFFVKAIAIYKKIIRLDPGQIGAYEALADLYNRQGLTGDSLAQYQVVADYYQKHDDPEAAIGVYRAMVEIEPGNPTRRLQLAGLLQGEGQTAKALDQYYEIANLMLQHSRGDDALRVLTEGLSVDSENLDYVRKAMHALQDGGFDRLAGQLLDAAVEKNPQANALRLDELQPEEPQSDAPPALAEEPAAAPPTPEPAVAPPAADAPPVEEVLSGQVESIEPIEASAEPPSVEASSPPAEPPIAEPPTGTDELLEEVSEPATAAAEDEEVLELDLEEIDLGELEELPPVESLDPVLPAAEPTEPALEDPVVEVEEEEPEFVLDDATAEVEEPPAPAVEPAVAEEPAADRGEDFGFELELDLDEPAETIASAPEPAAAAEPEPDDLAVAGESIKLLIEAEVLSRYGMDEMAISVLERIVRSEPGHAEAMARLVRLQLRVDRLDEALAVANQLADLVAAEGAPQSWEELCSEMAERGFLLEEGRFAGRAAPAEAEPAVEVEPEPAVEDVAAAEKAAPEVVEAPVADSEDEAPAEEPSLEELVAEAATEVSAKTQRPPDSSEDVLGEVIEEIERGAEPEEPEAADGSWLAELEEVEAQARDAAAEAADPSPMVPPAEPTSDEFVDLATELEAELLEEGGLEEELVPSLREQSLEDIVEGFRQGMAETLSEEDFDTHYNLGVAYQEMGLIDEAIGEFQLAAKDDRYLVECCSLLAACFVEKSFHDLAIQWYVRGIDSPAIDPESRLGLLYELGTLLASIGEPEAARERFLEIYGVNSNYRDVVAKLEELPA